MAVIAGKKQGYLAQFSFTPISGTAVQFKSLSEWELDIKGESLDASDHDTIPWKAYLTGMLDWDGTIKGIYFEGDATQQDFLEAMVAGQVMAGVFLPQINTGNLSYVGSFTVTGYKHGGATNSGVQTLDITIKCAGPLTVVAQSA
jgi:hypothetical protein